MRTTSAPSPLVRWFSGARVRILASIMLLLAFSALASILLMRQILHNRLDEEITTHFRQEVGEFRRLVGGRDPRTGDPFGSDIRAIFDVFFERNIPDEGEAFIAIVGRRIYRTNSSRAAEDLSTVELRSLTRRWVGLPSPSAGRLEAEAGLMRYLAIPIKGDSGNTIGTFAIVNFPAGERAEIDDAIRVASQVFFAVSLLSAVVAWVLAGRVLAPLRDLNETARSIGEGEFDRRIEVKGNDEISQIAVTFNDMLDRLEAAFVNQRNFIDDAGHELRTPITVIRGHLELLGDNPEERKETLALVMDELDRMARIVNDLLLLAKAQEPNFLTLETVNVGTLMKEVHAKASALAPRDWRLENQDGGVIVGDRQRLTQALMQLAANAVQHTVRGAEVSLGAALQDGEARFWVRDRGTGIPVEDQERIFERFTRSKGDKRRSEGAGLGLAIVKAIAEAHHGHVELRSRPQAGSTFQLVVPTDPPREEEPQG